MTAGCAPLLDTLRDLSDAKVVIMGHQSRPGKDDFTGMEVHCDRLSRLLGQTIRFVADVCGDDAITAIEEMQPGEKIFLEQRPNALRGVRPGQGQS